VPILTDWDESEKLLIRLYDGQVNAEEWGRVAPTGWEFAGLRRVLSDLSRWERDPSIDAPRIAAMGEKLASAEGAHPIRQVIVANQDKFQSAQQFVAAFAKRGIQAIVLSDLDVACAWLNLDPMPVRSRIERLRGAGRSSPVPTAR